MISGPPDCPGPHFPVAAPWSWLRPLLLESVLSVALASPHSLERIHMHSFGAATWGCVRPENTRSLLCPRGDPQHPGRTYIINRIMLQWEQNTFK